MPRTSFRRRVALLALVALVGVGACSGGEDDAPDEGSSASSTTSTTSATGSGTTDEDGATTTTAGAAGGSGGSTSTTVSGPTSTAAPSGTDADGVIELRIVGGQVEGGARREKVAVGSEVTLRVTSDVADEVHVHTYDLTVKLVPGQTSELTFLARIPGIHEVELEERGRKVLDLEVG